MSLEGTVHPEVFAIMELPRFITNEPVNAQTVDGMGEGIIREAACFKQSERHLYRGIKNSDARVLDYIAV